MADTVPTAADAARPVAQDEYRILLQNDFHLFLHRSFCELNPVRAGMVARARDYRWSSYRAHALGAANALLSDHPLYRALGRTKAIRQEEYQLRFRAEADEEFVAALRNVAPP